MLHVAVWFVAAFLRVIELEADILALIGDCGREAAWKISDLNKALIDAGWTEYPQKGNLERFLYNRNTHARL